MSGHENQDADYLNGRHLEPVDGLSGSDWMVVAEVVALNMVGPNDGGKHIRALRDLPVGTKLYAKRSDLSGVNGRVRPATDDEVREWAKRHDLDCWDDLTAARSAFEDAETHHLTRTAGVKGPDHG